MVLAAWTNVKAVNEGITRVLSGLKPLSRKKTAVIFEERGDKQVLARSGSSPNPLI
jgi:hypothetical protein